jgi:hypothetical protein
VGIALLLLALVSTAACDAGSGGKKSSSENQPSSSPSSQQSTKADVVVKEAGYVNNSMYAYLENRGDREVAINPGFVAYDAAGRKVDVSDIGGTAFYMLQPKSTTFVASGVGDGTISRVESKPRVATGVEIPKHGNGALEASVAGFDLSAVPETVRVVIKNSYQQDVSGAEISLACKNKAGKLNSITSDEFEVPKSAAVDKDVFVTNNSPDRIDSCEAFLHIIAGTHFYD